MGLADRETGSELSKNSNTLAEFWGLGCIMFGLKTVARCSAKTLDFSTSSVILELSLIRATDWRNGFNVSKDFFSCFPKRVVCWI